VNRAMRRALGRDGFSELTVHRHCADCGAPYCPSCGEHTVACPSCGGYECDVCGWMAVPLDADDVGLSCN
jgi:Zn finger protein HypA/HybF involved in hydrogenase expression